MGKEATPDTNLEVYNNLVKTPDFDSWDKWFNGGFLNLYPYVTEFVARAKKGTDFKSTTPAMAIMLGYAPSQS